MSQNYRALTRTYRPHTFDDIVSQEHVSSTLKNAIKQNRISHAYMFCGPRGVGKTTMARVLARAVNEIGDDVDGESLNQTLNIVEMDAASNRKIEDVRQLKDVIRVPPQNGRYKIFIIDEVHMLTKEAFNALLKTLEEPPAHAIFIFATTEPHKVLPTILSRVQRFDFKRISVEEIVSRLKEICQKEQITIDEESLHVIAKKADGALRDALGLMDQAIAFCGTTISHSDLLQALNVTGIEQLFDFSSAILNRDAQSGLLLIDALMREGADIQEFLVALTEHFRNLYIARDGQNLRLIEATDDTRRRYVETAKKFTSDDLMRMMHLTGEAQIRIKDVQQPRVHFEMLLLKLIHMGRSKELKEILNGLERLKKNSGNREVTPEKAESKSEPVRDSEKKPSAPDNETAASKGEQKPEARAAEQQTPEVKKVQPRETNTPESQKATKAPTAQATEDRAPEMAAESRPTPPAHDDSDVFSLKPSLGFARGYSSSNGKGADTDVAELPDTAREEPETTTVLKGVEDVESRWKEFLNRVKDEAPQMLYFQMLRVQIRELKGSELIVAADSEFATNLMQENQQLLSILMKRTLGIHIRIKAVVVQNKEKQKESISPYERFKELQRKDPHLKTIVELFGAELEY